MKNERKYHDKHVRSQHRTYRADAKNNQNAEAGARTYWPSTTPNFKFWSKNCVSTKRTASVTSARNITKRPKERKRDGKNYGEKLK